MQIRSVDECEAMLDSVAEYVGKMQAALAAAVEEVKRLQAENKAAKEQGDIHAATSRELNQENEVLKLRYDKEIQADILARKRGHVESARAALARQEAELIEEEKKLQAEQ